jgi:hypothetical protein
MPEWTIKKIPPYKRNRYPRGPRMKTPESWEKDELKKYLAGIGAFYFLTFAPGFGKSGLPDIVACVAREENTRLAQDRAFLHCLCVHQFESTADELRCAFVSGYAAGQRSVGAFWGIEVKREGFGPTTLQEARMEEVKRAGGMTAWGTAEKVTGEIKAWRKL